MESLSNSCKTILEDIKPQLIDKSAYKLSQSLKWFHIQDVSIDSSDLYPIAITGKGKPLLLLHGFDSCFLEFRRLIPHLQNEHQLIIPDLYGFGFCPRHIKNHYGKAQILIHLQRVLETLKLEKDIGIIGASMGGGIALELAKREPKKITNLLLLSPAGISEKPIKVPKPLNLLGACFLQQRLVRNALCRRAFDNPNNVGEAELQIASIHTKIPGWKISLAEFAREGGVGNCGQILPKQSTKVIWGANDRILSKKIRKQSMKLLNCNEREIANCGHLPHIDQPFYVSKYWKEHS